MKDPDVFAHVQERRVEWFWIFLLHKEEKQTLPGQKSKESAPTVFQTPDKVPEEHPGPDGSLPSLPVPKRAPPAHTKSGERAAFSQGMTNHLSCKHLTGPFRLGIWLRRYIFSRFKTTAHDGSPSSQYRSPHIHQRGSFQRHAPKPPQSPLQNNHWEHHKMQVTSFLTITDYTCAVPVKQFLAYCAHAVISCRRQHDQKVS